MRPSTSKNKRFLMKPLATSTPKAFTEHALNQGMAESLLERHSLDRENDDV